MRSSTYRLCLLLILAGLHLLPARAFATIITVGTGYTPSSAYTGVYANSKYATAEFALSPEELQQSGTISAFALYKDSSAAGTDVDSVFIYMRESDATITEEADLSAYTQVYSGSFPNSATSGWVSVTLDSSFNYTGVQPLDVLIVRKNGTKISTNAPRYYVSYSAGNEYAAAYSFSDINTWKSNIPSASNHIRTTGLIYS